MKAFTDRACERFNKYVKTSAGNCWEWTGGKFSNGYGQFRLDTQTKVCAHRFSYIVYNGNIPDDVLVLHKCNNKGCVNPEHLYAGSLSDNQLDIRKSLVNPDRGLTANQASLIKSVLRLTKLTHEQIANVFNVTRPVISYISRGESWTWVQEGAWLNESD